MTELRLSPPPDLGPNARYWDYRGWLLDNFYLELCSYCLGQYRNALSIDHYVPRSFDETLLHRPDNLLLSCPTCGRQKSDYHPDHSERRRLPHDHTGFLVLDVRHEDLGRIFELRDDGSLHLRPDLGVQANKRASWNIVLLRLDLLNDQRARVLEKLRLVEALRAEPDPSESITKILDILEPELAERLPMLEAFDIPISESLHRHLKQLATKDRHARYDPVSAPGPQNAR